MANTGTPDSGGCQFFITANVASQWNGKYTIFGQVVAGQDVVERVAAVFPFPDVIGERAVVPAASPRLDAYPRHLIFSVCLSKR